MIEVTDDIYLLRFIYDKYGYGFIAFSDLVKDIGWDVIRVARAIHNLESWGFTGDQRYGKVRNKPDWTGSGYCLDSKYATEWFFEHKISPLLDMIPCSPSCTDSYRTKDEVK